MLPVHLYLAAWLLGGVLLGVGRLLQVAPARVRSKPAVPPGEPPVPPAAADRAQVSPDVAAPSSSPDRAPSQGAAQVEGAPGPEAPGAPGAGELAAPQGALGGAGAHGSPHPWPGQPAPELVATQPAQERHLPSVAAPTRPSGLSSPRVQLLASALVGAGGTGLLASAAGWPSDQVAAGALAVAAALSALTLRLATR